jgi:hypothetical protein
VIKLPTARQKHLIRELLEELDWDKSDIASEIGEDYRDWKDLDVDTASDLINELIDRRRGQDRENR